MRSTQLEEIQQSDFYGILKAMAGKPTVIRLLDPPLHEFLPKYDDLLVETTELQADGQREQRRVQAEDAPAGHRGPDARAEPDAGPERVQAGHYVSRHQ